MLEGVRILAIHHDAGLNGATLLFQTVLEGLANDYGADISIRVPRDGPIVARARALGPVHIDEARSTRRTLRRRTSAKRQPTYDLIFANSAASLDTVEDLPASGTPLVVYIHESSYLLQHVVGLGAAARVLRRADLIFAVTPQVRATLEDLVRPAAPIVVVSGFVPVHPARVALPTQPRSSLPAPSAHARIVGAIGTMSWYKGSDLFIVVARRIHELLPRDDIGFVWVGDEWRPELRHELEHDVERAGLADIVSFPGRLDDPTEFLQSLSLLVLPSREDSWPLVMLEAAANGVPIVCFQGSGGPEHFVASGGGTAVPYLDVEAMARAAVRYLSDSDVWSRDSQRAREIARSPTPEEQIRTIAVELAGVCTSQSAK